MTKTAARKRINKMTNEYAYSDTWPETYQIEYERLCEIIHGKTKK